MFLTFLNNVSYILNYIFVRTFCSNVNVHDKPKHVIIFCISVSFSILIFKLNVKTCEVSSWSWSYGSLIYNYLCNQCPLMLWVRIPLGARCTTLCDKGCQWLLTCRWFSPCPPVSTNATDRHDIAELLLKVTLDTIIHQTNKQTNTHQSFIILYSIHLAVEIILTNFVYFLWYLKV